MRLADLLREILDVDSQGAWENERTPTPVHRFGVCLPSAGLSVRETAAVLELLGIHYSHGTVSQWTHRLADSEDPDPLPAKLARFAVDETAVQIGTDRDSLYAAVDLDSLYLLDIEVLSRHGADLAAAFPTNSPRHTTLPTRIFSSMPMAIGLPSTIRIERSDWASRLEPH